MQIINLNSNNKQISFVGAKDITLKYVMEQRKHLVPPRMISKINKTLATNSLQQPTLRELHINTYAPLLKCKNLNDAKKLFPEFGEIKDAICFENSRSPNVKKIKEHISLKDLTLKLLQDTWAKLKNQEDIAQELGLKGRHGIDWIKKEIGFINKDKNYTTLLKASDETLNQEIAAKQTAYNQRNPEQMYKRNKHAAQGCKTEEYKKAQAKRMKEYDKTHPERRQKISNFVKSVWEKIPDVKEKESQFLKENCSEFTQIACSKAKNGEKLNPAENRARKTFYKRFWQAHPECKERYQWAWDTTRAEKANNKTQ